jgi:8-oxo-dGTP pyrophosphatase MutT (NUDIX family)/translation initiation factor 2B subunit (eIF-2B alpha/beta/delta family)
MIATSIKRVVSCFILSGNPTREELKVAVFHRVDTMPTFPSHWAACSGSIEPGETPWQTARRELLEETNVPQEPSRQHGLYVDVVPFRKTNDADETIIIRVYPFQVQLPVHFKLKLRGTEHDHFKFISIPELEELEPAVPSLALAFHHATNGRYLSSVNAEVEEWAGDHVSGAATMTRRAVELVASQHADPKQIKMFRPSMVAITNAMNSLDTMSPESVLESLEWEAERAIQHAVQEIQPLLQNKSKEDPFVIATFSRSSTLLAVLKRLQGEDDGGGGGRGGRLKVVCAKSSPGDEGELMALDLNVPCVEDGVMLERIRSGNVDLLLTGSDCTMADAVVNKVGTTEMARAAAESPKARVFCCTDRWKRWDDIFPPPLEAIFERVPIELFDRILMPPAQCDEDT